MAGNPATLAPPFTAETAGDMARKATIAREFNRAQRKLQAEKANLASLAITPIVRAEKQVKRILYWMEKCNDRKEYANLVNMLDKLWNKAYPTQAAVKSPRSRQPVAPVAPISPVNPVGDPS